MPLISSAQKNGKLLEQSIPTDTNYLEELYLHLHRNPELYMQEKQTAARLARELRDLGFQVTENFAIHGLVGIFRNGEGPVVLYRTDMDALPVKEETGMNYASTAKTIDENGKEVPLMHACGHDLHMTVWVGTARQLVKLKKHWKGTLVFIAQSAEENGQGAKTMIGNGLFEQFPLPDYNITFHDSPTLEAGTVGICPEYAMANVDMMKITVFGNGGHGAMPNVTIDPVVLASRMVLAFQTIVSRELSPLDNAVLTVGAIHGGFAGNVIPNEVELQLTLRSFSDEVRQGLIDRIKRVGDGIAQSAGLSREKFPVYQLKDQFTPSVYNNPQMGEKLHKAFQRELGAKKVKMVPPLMTGEDFGRYGRTSHRIPSFMLWLGTVKPERMAKAQRGELPLYPLHSPKFAPDYRESIRGNVKAMTVALMELLDSN
jgi:hippurate hydrolase